jgi:hypothetical protein
MLKRLFVCAVLSIFSFGEACAVDAQKFLGLLVSGYSEKQGDKFEALGAESIGQDIVLRGVTFTSNLTETPRRIPIGDIVFYGVRNDGDDFVFSEAAIPKRTVNFGPLAISFGPVKLMNGRVYGKPSAQDFTFAWWERIESGAVSLELDGRKLASIDSASLLLSPYADGKQVSLGASIVGITWNPRNKDVEEIVKSFGIQSMRADFTGSMQWSEDGVLRLRDLAYDTRGLGVVRASATLSGIDRALVLELEKLDRLQSTGQNTDDKAANLLLQVLLNTASLRYENGKFVDVLFALANRRFGRDRETLEKLVVGTAERSISNLGAPALGREMGLAVRTFLSSPKSLTFSLEPKEPQPILFLSPPFDDLEGLMLVFGAHVTAND